MDEATRLRRKDTTKGPPLRILSLDGGGVRGFSMLIILQELMHRTFVETEGRAPKRDEIPRPCDHFDLIAGTGTGGLIAIMLGRLRLDLDTCMDLYVRMTRRAFETDKMFVGIPYGRTMFKASKLEEAIKEAVSQHTIAESEGNDTLANATPMTPDVNATSSGMPHRSMSQNSRYSQVGTSPIHTQRLSYGSLSWGKSDALLYDARETRTKTAVTAVFKGAPVTTLLRSYDSRKEPAPDVNCTIWQAGRATSAIQMAFKPIQIGQSWYLDEGTGKYNPAPMILDEAVQNEWPGREVGVFVSIGTGKRPPGTSKQSHEWWEGVMGGSMGDFADARRKFIGKLEGCEETHQFMMREHLGNRGVNAENYFRLNVEVGVGEFGMNEWQQLGKISTNTRTYLSRKEVEIINQGAAMKMAKIHFAKLRHDRVGARPENAGRQQDSRYSWESPWDKPLPLAQQQPANAMAVELPGDDMYYQTQSFRPGAQQYEHRPSIADQKYVVVDDDYHNPQQTPPQRPAQPYQQQYPSSPPPQRSNVEEPQNSQSSFNNQNNSSSSPPPGLPRRSHDSQQRSSPPPLPPKTPINGQMGSLPYPDQQTPQSPQTHDLPRYGPMTFMNMGELGKRLPYPDVEGPPPAVNRGNKPTMSR